MPANLHPPIQQCWTEQKSPIQGMAVTHALTLESTPYTKDIRMPLHVRMSPNDTTAVSMLGSASWKMGVMTTHIIGKAIRRSANHFTMAIWAVFQQCHLPIRLSIHMSLSLIPGTTHENEWRSPTEMRAVDAGICKQNAEDTCPHEPQSEDAHCPGGNDTRLSSWKSPAGQGMARGKVKHTQFPIYEFTTWDRPLR